MDKGMNPTEIIDNLLTYITLTEVMRFSCHIDVAQRQLSKHKWIIDGLKYLKIAMDEGHPVTLAHSEWIDKVIGGKYWIR